MEKHVIVGFLLIEYSAMSLVGKIVLSFSSQGFVG